MLDIGLNAFSKQANKSFLVKPLPIKCLHVFTLTVTLYKVLKNPQVSIEIYPINVGIGLGDSNQKIFYRYMFNFYFFFLSCWFLFCVIRFYCPGNWLGCND